MPLDWGTWNHPRRAQLVSYLCLAVGTVLGFAVTGVVEHAAVPRIPRVVVLATIPLSAMTLSILSLVVLALVD